MNAPAVGGCLCGGVRYEIVGEIGPANYCHCADCRKSTGSAFNVGVRVEALKFRVVKGAPKGFDKSGDSGNRLTRHFCADCGSPLYTSSPRHPDTVFVKAGSFDDPTIVRPAYQNWLASRADWAVISPTLPGYEKGRS